jgi:hypothetical protein
MCITGDDLMKFLADAEALRLLISSDISSGQIDDSK